MIAASAKNNNGVETVSLPGLDAIVKRTYESYLALAVISLQQAVTRRKGNYPARLAVKSRLPCPPAMVPVSESPFSAALN